MRHSNAIPTLALIAAFLVLGCNGSSNNPAAPEVEEEPAETFTETFDGSIEMGGTFCHDYVTIAVGDTQLTITRLQPLATLTVGLAIGTFDDSVANDCSTFAQDRSVRVGDMLQAQDLAPNRYCVCVVDVGNIFEDQTVTYRVSVTHT